MQRYLAWIVPVDMGATPTPPIHYPPGIWGPTDPRPGWGLPEQPPGIWGPTDPRPGWGLPGQPPGQPGGQPPGIWGPTDPRPGHGLPPTPPDIWGPNDPFPTPPIVIPGQPPSKPPDNSLPAPPSGMAKAYVFVPAYGWTWAYVPAAAAANPPKVDNTLPQAPPHAQPKS